MSNKNAPNRPNKYFFKFTRFILKLYLEHKSDIEVDVNVTKNLKPPYLVVGNHANNWDPIFANLYIDESISFVAADRFFRSTMLKKILTYMGAIPKTKFKPDLSTVKSLINAKKDKRIVGIFPEGSRNWDGNTVEIVYSTAKLVKMLKVPVVGVKLQGNYLSHPRWTNGHRKGKIVISYNTLLSESDILKLSEEEIHEKLVEGLSHDEYAFQREHMFSYKGKNLAENLELLLFTCPSCKSIDTMKSTNNTFYCQSCNYETTYTEKGFLEAKNQPLIFENPRDWNQWQIHNLNNLIEDAQSFSQQPQEVNLLNNTNVTLYENVNNEGYKLMPLRTGSINLTPEYFYFLGDNYDKTIFQFEKIVGLNIQSNNVVEFYYNDKLHKITFKNPKTSAYKWVNALRISNKTAVEKNNNKKRKVNYE